MVAEDSICDPYCLTECRERRNRRVWLWGDSNCSIVERVTRLQTLPEEYPAVRRCGSHTNRGVLSPFRYEVLSDSHIRSNPTHRVSPAYSRGFCEPDAGNSPQLVQ